QEGLDGARPPESFGRDFARVATFFLQELTTHHHVEDSHYFPLLVRAEPRLARGFEILDRDHHAIHAALDRFRARADDGLRALGAAGADPRTPLGALERDLASLEALLDRHLWDEEELVIPVMLDRGEDALA
ncbi:MAG: hemerythrin domain-containing protein, partial [Pseudomonadota bacterium]